MWFEKIIKQFCENVKYKWRHHNENTYTPQIKALKNPYRSCFDHCTCWFLQNISIKFSELTPGQVTHEIQSIKYRNWIKKSMGIAVYNRYKSNLSVLWNLQLKYIRDKLKENNIDKKVKINYNTSEKDLLNHIYEGSIIINTRPKYRGRRLGHVMLLVAFDSAYWWVDEPFGQYNFLKERYENHLEGNDILASQNDLTKCRGKLSISVV